ncbi:hypothetical protein TBR22_A37190 [Luteitalea sp. TBR-22]|uniref:DUF4097 family beta strand repeat-containing protein n=1 Tax=Luteitalea sp. TBR-22 TaxID=2802971 RepID=UPI001AF5EBAE|nr:DUF4097 family beta strand repeat-containing protein [Luteitalea sp. TBR-22]BCS34492.1 hypothetical protein TBR22_A37190 [Luteitalea sp. TBR-22]
MTGIWRGLMYAGVLAASQLGPIGAVSALEAAPLLTSAGPEQPAPPPPPPPAHPTPRSRVEAREAHAARQAAERASWVEAEAPIVRAFRGGEGVTLDLMNMIGDVVVVGGGKGREGKLSIVRRVQGRGPDTEALLKSLEIDVNEHANRVEVRTRLPRTESEGRWRARVRTDYEVALPAGTALELKNMKGNVKVTNVAGDVRVEAYAGDVVAEALSRVRLLRSMSGSVMLSRSIVDGEATLQTVSGDVLASGVKASSLTLGSVSGNVEVRDSSSDRTLVRTVSGDIEFAGAPRRAGRYEFKTHGGDILVVAPSSSGFEFEASTFRGDVRSDLASVPADASEGARQVRGTVGDGSAFFELTSFTGDIRVMKKAPVR